MFKLLMEEATDGTGGGSGGTAAAAPNIADGGNATGANAQPVGDGGSGAGASGGDAKSWLDTLPDDIKADPSLAMFKDPAGLARSYVGAQKMIGAEKVVMPNDKSTEEDWNAFYNKIGRPQSADKYELKLPEGQTLDETFAKGFKESAYNAGLSPKQVAKLSEWYGGVTQSALEAEKSKQLNELRDNIKGYADKLGGEEKYMSRVEDARVAVRALAKPELNEFLKKSGLGSRPEMIEFFAELKGMMSEDKIRDGTGVSFNGEDPSVLQNQIEEVEKKLFADMNNPNKQHWMDQRSKLYERLNHARARS